MGGYNCTNEPVPQQCVGNDVLESISHVQSGQDTTAKSFYDIKGKVSHNATFNFSFKFRTFDDKGVIFYWSSLVKSKGEKSRRKNRNNKKPDIEDIKIELKEKRLCKFKNILKMFSNKNLRSHDYSATIQYQT
jgi:hypothetical protein